MGEEAPADEIVRAGGHAPLQLADQAGDLRRPRIGGHGRRLAEGELRPSRQPRPTERKIER